MCQTHSKILKFTQNHKSITIPFVIYADTECLFEKVSSCDNNQTKVFPSKTNKHTSCGYSLFTHCSIDNNRSKHNFCKDKDSINKFCANLQEQTTETINYEKKETSDKEISTKN